MAIKITKKERAKGRSGVFSDPDLLTMRGAVRRVMQRVIAMHPPELTAEEYTKVFIPVHLREPFAITVAHAGNLPYGPHFVSVSFPGNDGPLGRVLAAVSGQIFSPRRVEIVPEAPPELVERVTTAVTHYRETQLEFMRVLALLEELNERCQTLLQLRYFWPGVLFLLQEAGLDSYLEKVRDFKQPRELVTLPGNVREACQLTVATLATAGLLPKELGYRDRADVVLHPDWLSRDYREPLTGRTVTVMQY